MISLLTNKYVLGGILIAALLAGCGFAYWHHGHTQYRAGIAAQLAIDSKAAAADKAAFAKQLQGAQDAYHAELDNIRLQPIPIGSVRLCINVPRDRTKAPDPSGTASAAPGTGNVQPVRPGDSGVRQDAGPDIGPLLGALGQAADRLAAQLRALQEAVK